MKLCIGTEVGSNFGLGAVLTILLTRNLFNQELRIALVLHDTQVNYVGKYLPRAVLCPSNIRSNSPFGI